MSVLINKKRCDNADVCSCISDCPTKAFYWDEKNETVAVNNNLCINCRQCMIACEAGAVKVARSQEEYEKIKSEYDEDIMTVEELFQDRYGASSVDEKYELEIDSLENLISTSNKPLLIEFYDEEEASCLINSIPITDIIASSKLDLTYRKINTSDLKKIQEYGCNSLPSFIIVQDGNIILKYEGFIDIKEKDILLSSLKSDLKNIN